MEIKELPNLIQPETLPTYTQAFKALGHAARLQIFFFLVTKGGTGANVSEIKSHVGIPDSTLSHHLETLRQAQLLLSDKQQQWIYYRVNSEMTCDLVRLLTACC
jgi:DNA-binding transcriptional ArsR family regulator